VHRVASPVALRPSRSEFHLVRGLRVHVRRWGDPQEPLLLLLHGWMDMSATFQFVVDALRQDWNIAAPDWPGYGLSAPRGADNFSTSMIADLDALLEILSPAVPVRVVAHSMGAQVATLYAGARPDRICGFVNLDGLAPFPPEPGDADLQRLRRWLGYARQPRGPRLFDSVSVFARELMGRNSRLTAERAGFLARQFTRERPDGKAELLADPRHYRGGPVPRFSIDVIHSALAAFEGPYLWILGGRSVLGRSFAAAANGPQLLAQRFACARRGRQVTLPDAGHNIHHDEPERVAALIKEFFAAQA